MKSRGNSNHVDKCKGFFFFKYLYKVMEFKEENKNVMIFITYLAVKCMIKIDQR